MSSEKPAPDGAGSSEVDWKATQESPKRRARWQGRNPIPAFPELGIHQAMMTAAWAGRKAGLTVEETIEAICAREKEARRPFGPREAEDAVEKVFSAQVSSRERKPRAPKVFYKVAKAEQVYTETPIGLENWSCASIVKDPDQLSPEEVLRQLFAAEDTLVCAGRSNWDFATATLAEHGDLSGHQFVVPGAMTAREGRTKAASDKLSAHTLENTGPRIFNVFDFDDPPVEWQPALIFFFARFRPPVMILKSGGKSLHAWFRVFEKASDNEKFWGLGLALGADPAIKANRSQFVRMPNGMRDNGNRQEVVFLNPHPSR